MTLTQREVTLSIVIATEGKRDSLRRAVNSALKQLTDRDEVIVVGPHELPVKLSSRVQRICTASGFDWGNKERQLGMHRCHSTHIMFLDDDDAYLPHALDEVRSAVSLNPLNPHMFQMIDLNGAILWSKMEVTMGNVGTPMFVFPNMWQRMGLWSARYEADYDFMVTTLNVSDPLIWVPRIIVGCRTYGDVKL